MVGSVLTDAEVEAALWEAWHEAVKRGLAGGLLFSLEDVRQMAEIEGYVLTDEQQRSVLRRFSSWEIQDSDTLLDSIHRESWGCECG
jgi:hypothetical protein